MPLIKSTLMAGIIKALNDAQKKKSTPAGNAALAKGIANAVHAYVKAATVNPGQVVVTAGSPTAQTGATTTPGTLS